MIIFKHTIKNCRLKSSIIKSFDHIPQIEFIGHASTTILNKNFDERVAYIKGFKFLIIVDILAMVVIF